MVYFWLYSTDPSKGGMASTCLGHISYHLLERWMIPWHSVNIWVPPEEGFCFCSFVLFWTSVANRGDLQTLPNGPCQYCHAQVQPDVVTFSAAISACEKSADWPWALEILEQRPSSTSCGTQEDTLGKNRKDMKMIWRWYETL